MDIFPGDRVRFKNRISEYHDEEGLVILPPHGLRYTNVRNILFDRDVHTGKSYPVSKDMLILIDELEEDL